MARKKTFAPGENAIHVTFAPGDAEPEEPHHDLPRGTRVLEKVTILGRAPDAANGYSPMYRVRVAANGREFDVARAWLHKPDLIRPEPGDVER